MDDPVNSDTDRSAVDKVEACRYSRIKTISKLPLQVVAYLYNIAKTFEDRDKVRGLLGNN